MFSKAVLFAVSTGRGSDHAEVGDVGDEDIAAALAATRERREYSVRPDGWRYGAPSVSSTRNAQRTAGGPNGSSGASRQAVQIRPRSKKIISPSALSVGQNSSSAVLSSVTAAPMANGSVVVAREATRMSTPVPPFTEDTQAVNSSAESRAEKMSSVVESGDDLRRIEWFREIAGHLEGGHLAVATECSGLLANVLAVVEASCRAEDPRRHRERPSLLVPAHGQKRCSAIAQSRGKPTAFFFGARSARRIDAVGDLFAAGKVRSTRLARLTRDDPSRGSTAPCRVRPAYRR